MNILTRRIAILTALAPLAIAPAVVAQNDAGNEWVRQSRTHESLLDIDFAGGALTDYYAGLAPMLFGMDRPMNVIVDPRASTVAMSPFSARSMAPEDALRVPGMLLPGVEVEATGYGAKLTMEGEAVPVAATFVVSIDPQNAWTPKLDAKPAAARLTIDFPGGPLRDYVAALRQKAPGANIVVSERAGAATVAPITLRDAPLAAAVQAVDGRLQGGALRVTTDYIQNDPIFAIDLHAPAEQTRVWSLAEHLQAGMIADDLLSGVEAAVGAVGEGGAIRFHAPTAMLIVRASPDQVDAAGQAVTRMLEVGRRRTVSNDDLRQELQIYTDQLVQARAELRIAEKQVEVARARLQQIREAASEGLTSDVSVSEAELEVVRADAELEIAARRAQRLGEEIKRLEERLDG